MPIAAPRRRSAASHAAAFCLLFGCVPAVAGQADDAAEAERFFESRVRPLLAERCFGCHNAGKQQGGVRLDTRAGVFGNEESGPLAVAGDVDGSRLLQVVAHDPLDTRMPPSGKLADDEIAVLTAWVNGGAVWPEAMDSTDAAAEPADPARTHWAFQPVVRPDVPTVKHADRVRTPVDAFLFRKLEETGIKPADGADRRTLVRRVYLDLLGVPPTWGELQRLRADDRPDWYPRLVDRLLDDPRYGERWARHWLDVARYADTSGYLAGSKSTAYPFAWTYRDYVVDAFNADKPFDRFVTEQLAADRLGLPPDAPELAALGFLSVGPVFIGDRIYQADDRLDVTTRGLMGLTVACARCHDHKYDPIPTEDYYSLFGVFMSGHVPDELPRIGEEPDTPEYRAFVAERDRIAGEAAGYAAGIADAANAKMRREPRLYLREALRRRGTPLPAATDAEQNAVRRAGVDRWVRHLGAAGGPRHPVWGTLLDLAALPAENFPAAAAAKLAERDAAGVPVNALVKAEFSTPPADHADLAERYARVVAGAFGEGRTGAAAVEIRQDADAGLTFTAADAPGYLNQTERNKYNGLAAKVGAFVAASDAAPPRAMVFVDRGRPFEPQVFIRGDRGRRGDRVPRQFPAVLSRGERVPFADGGGRLDLARAIVDPANPLTARVFVNRVWGWHFGRGLVDTASDFGTRADPPTHPDLLDWLTDEFVASGWSVKALHRVILNSDAYRRQSRGIALPRLSTRDPENRLLAFFPRRRLDFEAMRDASLSVSGLLDPRAGGPPFDLVAETPAPRRTVYAKIDRDDLPGLFRTFDLPSPDAHADGRPRTTVPQQALFALNSPEAVRWAASLASLPGVRDAADPADRVRALFRRVLLREPNERELDGAVRFLNEAGDDGPELLAQVLLASNEFLFVD